MLTQGIRRLWTRSRLITQEHETTLPNRGSTTSKLPAPLLTPASSPRPLGSLADSGIRWGADYRSFHGEDIRGLLYRKSFISVSRTQQLPLLQAYRWASSYRPTGVEAPRGLNNVMARRPRSGRRNRRGSQNNVQVVEETEPAAAEVCEEDELPPIRRNSTETSLADAFSRLHLSDVKGAPPVQSISAPRPLILPQETSVKKASTEKRQTNRALGTLLGVSDQQRPAVEEHKKIEVQPSLVAPLCVRSTQREEREQRLRDSLQHLLTDQTRLPWLLPRSSVLLRPTGDLPGRHTRGLSLSPGGVLLPFRHDGEASPARPILGQASSLWPLTISPHPWVWGDTFATALRAAATGRASSRPLVRRDGSYRLFRQLPYIPSDHEFEALLGLNPPYNLRGMFPAQAGCSALAMLEPSSLAEQGVHSRARLRCSARNTLLIFDWDDTLFPSSWLRCAGIDPLNPSQFSRFEDLPQPMQEALRQCEEVVLRVLEAANELGIVMVVSNAHTRWLRLSLDKLMPRVGALMRQQEVPVMSARCVCEAVGCTDATLWKTSTFDAIMDAFLLMGARRTAVRGAEEGCLNRFLTLDETDPIPRVVASRPAIGSMALEDWDVEAGRGIRMSREVTAAAEEEESETEGTGKQGQRPGLLGGLSVDRAEGSEFSCGTRQGGRTTSSAVKLRVSSSRRRFKKRMSKRQSDAGITDLSSNSSSTSGPSFSRRLQRLVGSQGKSEEERLRLTRTSVASTSSADSSRPRLLTLGSSNSCCSSCNDVISDDDCSSDSSCSSSSFASEGKRQPSFYNLLAFGDQAHDRAAFFTAAQSVLERRQERLPSIVELDELPSRTTALTAPNARSLVPFPSSRDICEAPEPHLGGQTPFTKLPLLEMPDIINRPFEVVVDFDDARLQQQVQELQLLQQREFRNPLPQRYQPMLPFAQQTAAVSERLSWHFRCPASPLLRHAPETLFERRQSRTSSDGSQPDTSSQPLMSTGGKKNDSRALAGSSQGSDVPNVIVLGGEPLQQGDSVANHEGRPRSANNRGKRNRLRRPGREFLLLQGHGRRSPAELRHRVSAPGTVRDAAGKTSFTQQHSKSDSTAEKQEQRSSVSPGTDLSEKDMPAVYCKSVKLMAGPSAAELTQQLGILLGILRDLAESPAFQDLQVEKQSSPPPSACPSSPGETSADNSLEPSLRREVDDPARAAAQAATAATAAAKAAAIAAAKAAATATEAATRGTGDSFGSFSSSSSPTGDFTSPVEAVLAATAAARAAATAAASAANAFAVTTQAGGKGRIKSASVPLRGPGCVVDAGVGTDMIPLPPEARQQREQEMKWIELEEAVDLARRAQLRQCFGRWRRASAYDNVLAELTQKTAERKEVSLIAEKKQGTTSECNEKKTTVAEREAEERRKEKAHQSGQRHRRPQSARFSDEKSWKDQDWEERGDRERQTINACLESDFDFHDKDDDPDCDEDDVSDALYNQILQEERCLRKQKLRRRNSRGKKRGGSGV